MTQDPAVAGMDPGEISEEHVGEGLPRARGDEPSLLARQGSAVRQDPALAGMDRHCVNPSWGYSELYSPP